MRVEKECELRKECEKRKRECRERERREGMQVEECE